MITNNTAGHLSGTKKRLLTCSVCGHQLQTNHRTQLYHKECTRKRKAIQTKERLDKLKQLTIIES